MFQTHSWTNAHITTPSGALSKAQLLQHDNDQQHPNNEPCFQKCYRNSRRCAWVYLFPPSTCTQRYEEQMWSLVDLQTSSIPTRWGKVSQVGLRIDLSRKVRKQSPVMITSSLMKSPSGCEERWIRITGGGWSQREAAVGLASWQRRKKNDSLFMVTLPLEMRLVIMLK